jgi:ankyrin repeat protein
MSEQIPAHADVRQLRTQAKELLTGLNGHEPAAVALAALHDPSLNAASAKLADAQRIMARRYGFSSWPQLVAQVETPQLVESFKQALYAGDAVKLEALLSRKPTLRKQINEPIMGFDSPPIVAVVKNPNAAKVLPILHRFGADPNARSKWWAGGFSALDGARGETVDLLLQMGAKFDVWSASAHGRVDVLKELLDADPTLVNAPGGDGERPLHFAGTPEVAELLIGYGADLEARDIDHESTPIQYQIKNPDVCRVLLKHGAKPDIFTAVALNDLGLVREVLKDSPGSATATVGNAPFCTKDSDGGHIYVYVVGGGKSPLNFAAERGYVEIVNELSAHSTPAGRLVAAAWMGDEATVDEILRQTPTAVSDANSGEAGAMGIAAQEGRTETVRLLLKAGFDPTRPAMDSGTSLHVACWFGHLDLVKLLVSKVPLDLLDAHHGSPPLGWATHGAQWCRNPKGDYVGVVEELIRAGADPLASANSEGTSMLKQAGSRDDVKAALRAAGAT